MAKREKDKFEVFYMWSKYFVVKVFSAYHDDRVLLVVVLPTPIL